MNKDSGAILVLSGPSGAGKSSLIAKIKPHIGEYYFSISTTTRAMRSGEEDGIDYFFVSKEEFKQDIEDEHFLEYAMVHGNYYGTSLKPVKKALNSGKLVIFDIDVQGHDSVQNRLSDITTSVFITTQSFDILKQRLNGRATDNEDIIQKRLKMAKMEIQRISEFDYIIVNDKLEEAAELLITVAKAARLKIPTQRINQFVYDW
ncbi:MAG: guanylate kinase [Campylobacterota bacterium]|nr:guanylate kinase [Campylobacterota bacterium]